MKHTNAEPNVVPKNGINKANKIPFIVYLSIIFCQIFL